MTSIGVSDMKKEKEKIRDEVINQKIFCLSSSHAGQHEHAQFGQSAIDG